MTIDAKIEEAGFRPASRISTIGVSEDPADRRARRGHEAGRPDRSSSWAPANLISKRPTTSSRRPGTRCSAAIPSTPRSTARRR